VWRRYNDIKHLYKAMHKLHAALHRKDEFPPFAEAKLFGKFNQGRELRNIFQVKEFQIKNFKGVFFLDVTCE
jgi:hypothetical protein